jgi:hypothetical protein
MIGKFQALRSDEISTIGLIRLYDTDDMSLTVSPHPYVFFTAVEIKGTSAFIHGLSGKGFSKKEFKSFSDTLKSIGVTSVSWEHNTKIDTHIT